MKIIQYLTGILCTFSLILVLLISSFELAVYGDMGYFEREYTKYDVLKNVHMEMNDLMDVTREMMDYLRGDRENLHVPTMVGGERREFFNEREILHMEDVRNLFLKGLLVRKICLVFCLACLVLLFFLKSDWKKMFPRCVQWGTGLFFVILAILAGVVAGNFNKYFVIFHKIFFTNDLWLLDPSTDLLINIVPEPFFMDTAARIGLIFGTFILVLLGVSTGFRIYFKKKEKISHA